MDSSAVVSIKAFDGAGRLRFRAGRWESPTDESDPQSQGALFYLWMAENALNEERMFLPVELRDPSPEAEGLGVMPSIAILQPIRTANGDFLGVVVAQASAATLFRELDSYAPASAAARSTGGSHGSE